MTNYPNGIDDNVTLPPAPDGSTNFSPINALRDAILAVEIELGITPKGVYSDTRTRIDILESRISFAETNLVRIISLPSVGQTVIWNGSIWSPSTDFVNQPITTTGSITSGPSSSTSTTTGLITLNGKIVLNGISPAAVSSAGQGIIYFDNTSNSFKVSENGASYVDMLSGFTAAGDLSGNSSSQTVIGLQTIPVSSTTPSSNNALVFDGADWAPTQLTLDPELIGAAFAVSLSGGTLVDVGNTVTTPSFNSTKNYTGTAAVLTNTDNAESKNVLTEFNANTAFISSFNYTKNTYGATVTFTLTANKGAIVRTGNTSFVWTKLMFWGSAPIGASDEAFIESLSNSTLVTSRARTISLNVAASQYLWIAYRSAYGTASFVDGNSGLAFDMTLISTTIPVTNAFADTENYTLYRSTNSSLGNITIIVS